MIRYLFTLFFKGFYVSAAAVGSTLIYGLVVKEPLSASVLAIAHFLAFFALIVFAVLAGTGNTPEVNARTYISTNQSKVKQNIKVFDTQLALSLRLFIMSLVPLAVGLVVHFFFV